jgi:hypothetical protein
MDLQEDSGTKSNGVSHTICVDMALQNGRRQEVCTYRIMILRIRKYQNRLSSWMSMIGMN